MELWSAWTVHASAGLTVVRWGMLQVAATAWQTVQCSAEPKESVTGPQMVTKKAASLASLLDKKRV